jgi:hypothetical protein
MFTRFLLFALFLSLLSCSKETSGTSGMQAGAEAQESSPVSRSSVQEQAESVADSQGTDCAALAAEIRQACTDRYAKGVMVDCDDYASTLSMYGTPSSPTKAKVASKMCARIGDEFHAARDAAKQMPVTPTCVELGNLLDEQCFQHIGTSAYNDTRCDQWLASSRPMTEQACAVTLQLARSQLGG